MAENSGIQWTTHSWNPWRGCTKISAGCQSCYAETMSKRNPLVLGMWGPKGTRVVAAEAQWKLPVKWNREAGETVKRWEMAAREVQSEYDYVDPYERPRVFCASLADVFEAWDGPMVDSWGTELCICHECGTFMHYSSRECKPGCTCDRAPRRLTMQDVRARLFRLIDDTPNLDWLVLTKRPENIAKMMPAVGLPDAGVPGTLGRRIMLPNLWLGTSVENQTAANERIPHLLRVPAAVRFLSVEPMLGPVDLEPFLAYPPFHENYKMTFGANDFRGIDWCIIGGESGPRARPCNVSWIRSVVEQCKAAEVPVFVKQLGANIIDRNDRGFEAENERWAEGQHEGQPTNPEAWPTPVDVEHDLDGTIDGYQGAPVRVHLVDKKGGDMDEWPSDLRVREFPRAEAAGRS